MGYVGLQAFFEDKVLVAVKRAIKKGIFRCAKPYFNQPKMKKSSNRIMNVRILPALLGNYDRPTTDEH